MGTWGPKILENDIVGNALCKVYKSDDDDDRIVLTPKEFVREMFNSEYEYYEEYLLGIAIVDASINGVNLDVLDDECTWGGDTDKIQKFFEALPSNPLVEFVDEAKEKLQKCISLDDLDDWKDQESRRFIYDFYLRRFNMKKE